MAIHEKRIREVAARRLGIRANELGISKEDGFVLINYRDTMRLDPEERKRLERAIAVELGGVSVSLT